MRDSAARAGLSAAGIFTEFLPVECDQPIHRRFEQQAARCPEAAALRLPSGDIAYAELNAAANRAARRLLVSAAVGTGRDLSQESSIEWPNEARPIALLLNQSYESIVWTLAILKTGHSYAPLDQRLPLPVLRDMIEQLDPAAVVAAVPYGELARDLAARVFPVIDAKANLERFSSTNLDGPVSPDRIAYIFYTSGSTGAPKGVADCHRNVQRNILRYTNTLKFAPGDILSLVQNPSFSGTVSSLFGALLNGAALAPFDLEGEGLPALSDWLRRTRVTVFHAVPSIFRQLSDPVNRFPDIRLVRLEGDRVSALDVEHFRAHFQDHCTLVNGLGATECGLVRQFFVNKQTPPNVTEPVPIGYAVPDMTVRIVDERGALLPPGSTGEIVVESDYLAIGYWRNPALTAEKFTALNGSLRCYRTGDLGRMSAEGCLLHLGRVDHRLRIAGEFVDAAAIEGQLLKIAGVKQCAVRDFEDQLGERRLCAYLVADASVTVTQLRQALSERLPQPMVPSVFVFLAALPLTKDLKIDHQRLPRPGRQRPPLSNDFVAPKTPIEQQMARLWSEVLEIDEIGVLDSFFDLGGDSLRAARLASGLKQQLGLALRVTSLFEHGTIRALARFLDGEQQPADQDRAKLNENDSSGPSHSIAIIGMANRFPGADSLEEFWENLRAGRESITFLSSDGAPSNAPTGSGKVAARGLLSDVDQFDAALFRLTPRQAQMLDPQQRQWLECVHRALEDAGLPLDEFGFAGDRRSIGVFTGGRESSYLWHLAGGNQQAVNALVQRSSDEAQQLMISNDSDSIATRTSFVFGFQGPSINVQTACSTSLVAVAQACQALVSGACDMAIAGGVAVTFPQEPAQRGQEAGIHSHDGHCRAFDAAATGTVFGDGVGAVLLKRLDDALAAGERIHAVIRGWAVNNDGSNKASFAAPSIEGQTAVIARAQDHARVRPEQISLIEAHGTGTLVGDPIEFTALERVFRRSATERGFCALGSVKTNIGHLDTAAGIAGLIKTVLALQHREIPPVLHFRKANPEIDLDVSPFYIPNRLLTWPNEAPRIAAVSSFGVGGTNCHMILEEAPNARADTQVTGLPGFVITLSAASAAALEAMETSYTRFLAQNNDAEIAAIAATTQRSRSHYSYRTAIVGETAAEIRVRLSNESKRSEHRWRGKATRGGAPAIAFLFAGQGAQYAGMGRALYEANPEFHRTLQRCEQILHGELERPLLEVMFAGPEELLQRTEYAQPALFALEYALAELLRSWGIGPCSVLGHSLGEYVAACIAGVFSLEEGIVLAARRGRLMQQLPGDGRMLAVTAEKGTLDALIERFSSELSVAAINTPTQIVLSGDARAIEQVKAALQEQGLYCRELAVSHAFHSAQMIPALAPIESLLSNIDLRPPRLPLISNLYGGAVTTELTDPTYWRDHARRPVQFAAGMRTMIEAGCEVFVEIGPDKVLSYLTQDFDARPPVETVSTLRRGDHDWIALLETVARLYVRGAQIDWNSFQNGRKSRPARLPNYPFQHRRYWYDGPLLKSSAPAGHPLLGRRLRLPGSAEIRFETRFSQTAPHFLTDHRLFGVSLPPGASHFAMLSQASEDLVGAPAGSFRFENLYMLRPLLLPDGCERHVQLIFRPEAQDWNIELTSSVANEGASGDWTPHMIGLGRAQTVGEQKPLSQPLDLDAIKLRCRKVISSKDFYSRIWANQGGTGSAFRWVDSVWRGEREALGRAVCPESVTDAALYRLHPGLIEAACQVLHCCETIETAQGLEQTGATFVPFAVDAFILFNATMSHDSAWCHALLRDHSENDVLADLSIFNDAGELAAKLEGFRLRPITRDAVIMPQTTARTSDPTPPVRPALALELDKPAASLEEMTRYLQLRCAELSGYPESQITSAQSFMALGLDSLVAMMLANQIRRDFAVAIAVTQILLSKSLESLANDIWQAISQ